MRNEGHRVWLGFVGQAADVGRCQQFEEAFLSELNEHDIGYFFIGNECRRHLWRGCRRVKDFVSTNSIDIYHSHLMYGIVFGAILNVPRVYTHHNVAPRAGKLTYMFFNRLVDRYVGISTVCSKKLEEFTGANVLTIRNGVDLSKFSSRAKQTHNPSNQIRCIAVGGLCEQKNYRLMLEAISIVPKRILKRVHLSICGEGSEAETDRLAEMVRAKGLARSVSFLGNRSDVPALLAGSDLFLMSSAWEGLPISLIEASAAGLACVVTDVGGCAEVISVCRNGRIVPPDDAEELASAIIELVSSDEKLNQLKSNSTRYSSAFGIQASCHQHLELYRESTTRTAETGSCAAHKSDYPLAH